MGDSPEEILARLIRYRDSLPESEVGVRAAHATAAATAAAPGDPSRRVHRALNAVEATLLGQLLATLAGALGIIAFERLALSTAVVVVAAMVALGVAAVTRRVPLSVWWTLGALIGGALGRWS